MSAAIAPAWSTPQSPPRSKSRCLVLGHRVRVLVSGSCQDHQGLPHCQILYQFSALFLLDLLASFIWLSIYLLLQHFFPQVSMALPPPSLLLPPLPSLPPPPPHYHRPCPQAAPSQSPWLILLHFPKLSTLRAQSLYLYSGLSELIQNRGPHGKRREGWAWESHLLTWSHQGCCHDGRALLPPMSLSH